MIFRLRLTFTAIGSLRLEGSVAYLTMNVDPKGGINPGYELKMNSYDLGVDIELADAVRRLRFEHPEVGAVVIGSDLDRMFCVGANIGMLASASHALKVLRVRQAPLEQPDDVPVVIDVDLHVSGCCAQSGHRAHVPENRIDKAGTDRCPHFSHPAR